MNESTVRVGVLSFHDSKESKVICNAVEALGHEPVWLREKNALVRFTGEGFVLEPDVDVVINRLLLSTTKQPAEAAGFANAIARFRPIVNHPDAAALASHKIAAGAALVANDVPVPETALALGSEPLARVRPEFGEEHVYKTVVGTHGGVAWKVDRSSLLTGSVGSRRAFLQELVATESERPRDLRIYVVDGDVAGAMYRYAADEEWRTNVARGGAVEDVTDSLPETVAEIAIRATAAVGLDCAGVDLIEGEEGWFVLEVNPTAGFKGLFRATGRSPAPDIAALAIERAGGSIDADRVATLRKTLDDSVPFCVPKPGLSIEDEAPTVGLTERVIVSGTTNTKAVVGRADTGRSRTRIDLQLAAAIGAGPIRVDDSAPDRDDTAKRHPIVDVVVGIAGTERTVDAMVEDRSTAAHSLLLGRDVLEGFRIDISSTYDAGVGDENDERIEE
ncbi:30S ribosomal protein S6--L-glutamate ligase [Natronorubrum sp. JWXQ-INN-674]|uniref:30S ribosomal protein S6--L-glutamate ligase n=1 Tax=Natronorubrum halalkaliphilum TaxID=2691917 RepID=A0A6B0VR89_9EURY|nr:30S ribosomal protein S6--L-glutamate ligase [Natronorubrum halalkaliphilum]MXV64170.1 30S ribosomal protein S6--L-glutamate ligase [Natronorubrum halalkaliphilum]